MHRSMSASLLTQSKGFDWRIIYRDVGRVKERQQVMIMHPQVVTVCRVKDENRLRKLQKNWSDRKGPLDKSCSLWWRKATLEPRAW